MALEPGGTASIQIGYLPEHMRDFVAVRNLCDGADVPWKGRVWRVFKVNIQGQTVRLIHLQEPRLDVTISISMIDIAWRADSPGLL